MGLFKDLLIGGAALKALRRSDRPVVLPPPTCSVVGLEHKGFGSTWKVTYIYNHRPNVKLNFTVNKSTKVRTSGGDKWHFQWS
jgi:hypothetical protein